MFNSFMLITRSILNSILLFRCLVNFATFLDLRVYYDIKMCLILCYCFIRNIGAAGLNDNFTNL